MTLHFDPATYPGWRPDGPSLVLAGRTHPVAIDPERPTSVRAPLEAPVLEPGAVRWVVAYGSNACPDRLVDKGLDDRGALLLPATLRGWVPAFEARPTGYGAVPLTLVPRTDAATATWVLGVHVDDTPRVDASEGRVAEGMAEDGGGPADAHHAPAGAYRLAEVGEAIVAGCLRLAPAVAFVPGPHTRLQVGGDGRWMTWPHVEQRAAAAHLVAGRRDVAAPPADRVVAGPWPATALRRS